MSIINLYRKCRASKTNFLVLIIRAIYYKLRGKNILAHQNTQIIGLRNINTHGKIELGIRYTGFAHNNDRTFLNIKGALEVQGNFSFGRGCRIDIDEGASLIIKGDGYINAFSKIILAHHMQIGQGCVISWDCQFLDDDYHTIEYEGKKAPQSFDIIVGDYVWIGCGAKIYKGTVIPDGCVVASDSVVRGIFIQKNALIAGNPAKVIKDKISWH